MQQNDFENQMENLKKPEVNPTASQQQIRLTLLNTKRSALWGMWLLALPVFFFCCVTIKYFLGWNWGIGDSFIEWLARMDKQMAAPWISLAVFILLPAICAVLNLASILHFVYSKATKELLVAVRLRWLNIGLALLSIAVIGIVFLYAVKENAHHQAIQQILTKGK